MKTSGGSEEALAKAARRTLLKPGKYPGTIVDASEQESQRGNETMKLTVIVEDGEDGERTFTDYLSDSAAGGLKLRHACAARGTDVLAKFEAGSIDQSDLPGRVLVTIGIQNGTRAYPNSRNVILDYEPAEASVVSFRSAKG